jgi:hypothetical protein
LASIEQIFVTRFGEFGEFGEFGKFGEGRLDHFIHKKIFFLYIKRPSLKIRQIRHPT